MATWAWGSSLTTLVRTPHDDGGAHANRIAAFDWDSTLVSPISPGLKFSNNPAHWRWFNDKVVPRLRELHAQGYRLCVFSNQAGTPCKWESTLPLQRRLDHFLEMIPDVPVTVMVALKRDEYRKPSTGMWDMLVGDTPIDMEQSFFVGDAAGRPGDFADSDLKFARAAGLRFLTPEQAFGCL